MITKQELRKDVVPFVRRFLIEECGMKFYGGKQRDQVGHAIHTHATSAEEPTRYPATIVYETCSWAWEFIDWVDEAGYADDYEFEALSSYEISVVRVYAPAPGKRS